MLVVLSIMGITAMLVIQGLPQARMSQQLLLSQQQIKALIRQLQQQALNGQSSPACLSKGGTAKTCANVGLAFKERDYVLFSDTANSNNKYDDDDFVMSRHTLPQNTSVVFDDEEWHSYVFIADPPVVTFFVDGNQQPTANAARLTLVAGDKTLKLDILGSGVVNQVSQ